MAHNASPHPLTVADGAIEVTDADGDTTTQTIIDAYRTAWPVAAGGP